MSTHSEYRYVPPPPTATDALGVLRSIDARLARLEHAKMLRSPTGTIIGATFGGATLAAAVVTWLIRLEVW